MPLNPSSSPQLQAIARGVAVRRQYKAMMDYYRAHEAQIIKAQAYWRGKLARMHYVNLRTHRGMPWTRHRGRAGGRKARVRFVVGR